MIATTAEPIVFKQDVSPKHGWFNYGMAMVMLLIIILVLAKKYKFKTPSLGNNHAGCQLIEKKHLGNRTVIYVIKYKQQQFLLADNQHALAIHPLEHGNIDETV